MEERAEVPLCMVKSSLDKNLHQGPSTVQGQALVFKFSFCAKNELQDMQWAASQDLLPLHRFQAPVDEESEQLQNTCDDSMSDETQAR